MVLIETFFWWYASGWATFIKKVRSAFASIADFFSMSSLLRTLFKPYRQISAASASADSSLDLKFHMFLDRFISRLIGFCSRLILLLVGTIIILTGSILSLILIILWPFLPLAPLAGLLLTLNGVTL